MLWSALFTWCWIAMLASANTEAFYFSVPNDMADTAVSKIEYPLITTGQVNDISITVPSPSSQDHLVKWYRIDSPPGVYNARLSWSALDPIDIVHFDFETKDSEDNQGLFLYLEVKYDCYTKDKSFMLSDHEVDLKIYISPTWCFIPIDLLPNIGLIITLLIIGYSSHGYIFNFLKSLR